jgi:acetyl esterase/lipase
MKALLIIFLATLTACIQAANPAEPARVVSPRLQLATKLQIRDVNLDKTIEPKLINRLKEQDDRADHPIDSKNFVQRFSDFSFLEKSRKEKLDVYIPSGEWKNNRPAVLFIHGGGFKIGDKAESRSASVCADLARAGYVAVSCNYVLSTKDKPGAWPQNIADCREAVRWMRQNARDLGIDPQRIAVAGGSAGGYLALMVGLTDEKPELGGDPKATVSSKVSAVIDMYGVTSCGAHGKETIVNPGADADKIFSPINYVTSKSVPILILHGTADKTVDIKESKNLEEALIKNKVDYNFVEVEEGEHTFDLHPPKAKGWKLSGAFKGQIESRKSTDPDVKAVVVEFLERTIGK